MKDLTGQKFGRWTVLREDGRDKFYAKLWLCRCDCGKEVSVIGFNLIKGTSKSCGCYIHDITRIRATTHGHTKNGVLSSEYQSWKSMLKRCTEENNKAFKNYGGRGITVCGRWLHSFENFIGDMGNKPTPKHTLERKDVNGDYSPENCKWATHYEQAHNKRIPQNNTSGVMGVPWNKRDKRWTPNIKAYGKQIRLGSFKEEDKEKAIQARKEAEIKYWNKQPS